MARLIAHLSVENRGLDDCIASFISAAEAVDHAHADEELSTVDFEGNTIRWQGMDLNSVSSRIEGWTVICEVKPAPALILFAATLMAALPARARVTWNDGWPTFYCPPNDDRDSDSDPTPLVPNELVPA